MPSYCQIKSVNRIIDANINRVKEGLRVCEEITRFILNNSRLTAELKAARHKIDEAVKTLAPRSELLRERQSGEDVGKKIYINELKRRDVRDIFFANIQRSKESVRVLEEFSKLINKAASLKLKEIRYRIYEIEKESAVKLSALIPHKK